MLSAKTQASINRRIAINKQAKQDQALQRLGSYGAAIAIGYLLAHLLQYAIRLLVS